MNVLIVDTSAWISYFKGRDNRDIDLALAEGRVYISPIVVAELLSGKLSKKNRLALIDFIRELPVCETQLGHWIRVGELRNKLFTYALSVSTPDAHIAQCCLDLDGYLISEDAIFRLIAKRTNLKLL